ncbi:transposon TX1 [Tanacetum coccineum]
MVSFMFSNFLDEWGMGNLWMLFKKYGTVFDMFMVQKRLRNGQRYGFVRYKFVSDVEELLMKMDRREMNNKNQQATYNGMNGRSLNADMRGYTDGGVRQENTNKNKEGRVIEVGEKEFNGEVINRSLIGEVKKGCFLSKIPSFCEDQGLNKVEVKMLGGTEVMIILDATETVDNILNNREHGIRRSVHNLRRWSKFFVPSSLGEHYWITNIVLDIICCTITTTNQCSIAEC